MFVDADDFLFVEHELANMMEVVDATIAVDDNNAAFYFAMIGYFRVDCWFVIYFNARSVANCLVCKSVFLVMLLSR